MVGRKGRGPKSDTDSTVSMRIYDPALEKISFSGANIESLKKRLSLCTLVHNQAGINFQNFISNLKGMSPIKLGDVDLVAIRTRKSLFLLSNLMPENLYEIPALMDVDLKMNCILKTHTGKPMYICLISSNDFLRIMNASRKLSPRQSIDIASSLYEAIEKEDYSLLSLEEFTGQIARCRVTFTLEQDFSARKFAESIKFFTVFKDEQDEPHYFIQAGENEDPYRLYVHRQVKHPLAATCLSCGKSEFVLVKED